MAKNVAIIGSVTYSMKLKKALDKMGIRTTLVKTTPRAEGSGCTYGVEYDAKDEMAVAETLRRLGLSRLTGQ